MALLAGSAEFFGGLALMLGLLVRPAAAALAFAMLVAIFAVHIDKGLFLANNGYEFGLALLAVAVALADQRCRARIGRPRLVDAPARPALTGGRACTMPRSFDGRSQPQHRRRGLPAGNRFIATLLILREFMHHRGFASVCFTR